MKQGFDDIVSKVKECSKKKVAISVAQDEAVLEAVKEAKKLGIADAILVGDEEKIREDLLCDGLKCYRTNTELSPEEVYDAYLNLWNVERSFRMRVLFERVLDKVSPKRISV